jgi:DNA-binding NarL/FixJ family response regulator
MSVKQKNVKHIFIIDDHPMMRNGLAQLIGNERGLKVSGEADNAAQAMKVLASPAQEMDLVLCDISLPDKNGLELIKDIRALHPELPILVVSMHDELIYAERVLRAGGRGYIMKQEGGEKFIHAIRQVLAGQIYVSDKMSSRILEIFSGGGKSSSSSPVGKLSDREFEVFQLIGQGMGTRDVAEQLHLSIKTVEVHRANIKAKLEIKTATDLVRCAVRWADSQGGK